MANITFQRYTGEQTFAILDDLARLYEEVHSDPLHSDPIFTRPQFVARTDTQARREGFELVTAHVDEDLAGFSFGFTFSPGRWWADASPPSQEILNSSKFAVIELDVRIAYQGQGLGKRLLETLLSRRCEDYATLATIPESAARGMYERWGWRKEGTIGGEGPVMDAMIISLIHEPS